MQKIGNATWRKNHHGGLFTVDDRKILEEKAAETEQEIATISRSLKAIAKELNVPVIALSQLSRTVKKPVQIRDLNFRI